MEEPRKTSLDVLEAELGKLSPLSTECSIYRVPKHIRQRNKRAYTPKAVSIGPFHHGGKKLQAMEEYKKRYLKDFLHEHKKSLQEMIEFVREREEKVRNSYAETIHMNSDEFVKIILLDSVFIIVLLTKNCNPYKFHNSTDRIYGKQKLINDVWIDIWLVENQLPFFILQDILDMLPSQAINKTVSALAYTFLEIYMGLDFFSDSKAEHFVDFLRNLRLPPKSETRTTMYNYPVSIHGGTELHPVGGESEVERKRNSFSINIPSATELHQAGVKFKQTLSKNLFDIQFKDGVLEIPRLRLGNQSDVLYGNLIVFEQCHDVDYHINDYFLLMDQLIDTDKDVDLLIKKGIIQSLLGSSSEVANLINDLGKIVVPHDKFYFHDLFHELTKHCENPCNSRKANLRQNYFNTPWAGLSAAGAIFLLVLTLTQTVFTILSVVL